MLTSLRLWSSGSVVSFIVPSLISLSTTLQPTPRYLPTSPRLIIVSGARESRFLELGMASCCYLRYASRAGFIGRIAPPLARAFSAARSYASTPRHYFPKAGRSQSAALSPGSYSGSAAALSQAPSPPPCPPPRRYVT